MTHLARRLMTPALVLGLAATLGACQQPSRPRASAAVTSACRTEVDRVYAAQNRADLSMRDQRDTPFAGSYNSGITSRGLSAEYGRDNMMSSCLNNSGAPAPAAAVTPGTGPAFSPATK